MIQEIRRNRRTRARNRCCFPRACRRRRSAGSSFECRLWLPSVAVARSHVLHVLDAPLASADTPGKKLGQLPQAFRLAARGQQQSAGTPDRAPAAPAENSIADSPIPRLREEPDRPIALCNSLYPSMASFWISGEARRRTRRRRKTPPRRAERRARRSAARSRSAAGRASECPGVRPDTARSTLSTVAVQPVFTMPFSLASTTPNSCRSRSTSPIISL